MNIIVKERLSEAKDKIFYSLEWGRSTGQRKATGIFSYAKPKNQFEKNHNKEALAILNTKKSQMILDQQAINSGYIPQHKIKGNFLEYYSEFVKLNSRKGNRHLSQSLQALKKLSVKSIFLQLILAKLSAKDFGVIYLVV